VERCEGSGWLLRPVLRARMGYFCRSWVEVSWMRSASCVVGGRVWMGLVVVLGMPEGIRVGLGKGMCGS
jgi:hypothetical protein